MRNLFAKKPCPAATADQSQRAALVDPAEARPLWRRGFTLIEILVVISIIGLLATLTVGLTGVASRKSKESRIKSDMNKLLTAIENYKAALGMYPRDNPGRPSTNQLFYELSGTFYTPSGGSGSFSVADRPDRIDSQVVSQFFNAPGFGNSVRSGEKLKFTEEFSGTQYKRIGANPPLEILVVPVKPPPTFTYNGRTATLPLAAADGTQVNPWLYDSSSPFRNNRSSFDLWTEVVIGKNIVRFSNWEKDPVVIGKAP